MEAVKTLLTVMETLAPSVKRSTIVFVGKHLLHSTIRWWPERIAVPACQDSVYGMLGYLLLLEADIICSFRHPIVLLLHDCSTEVFEGKEAITQPDDMRLHHRPQANYYDQDLAFVPFSEFCKEPAGLFSKTSSFGQRPTLPVRFLVIPYVDHKNRTASV